MEGNPIGRPTKYKKEYDHLVYKLALLGLTDVEMADILDISHQTFYDWQAAHPSFLESVKKGKDPADANVALSLYKRANGFITKEVTKEVVNTEESNGLEVVKEVIKEVPPDTAACCYWLNNRRPDRWRNKIERQESDKLDKALGEIAEAIKGDNVPIQR